MPVLSIIEALWFLGISSIGRHVSAIWLPVDKPPKKTEPAQIFQRLKYLHGLEKYI